MNKAVWILMLAFFGATTQAQTGREARDQRRKERQEKVNQLIKQEEQGAIVYNKQSVFAIKLNTDGYGVFYEIGKQKTLTRSTFLQFELGERKHPKEERISPSLQFPIVNPVVYGKINNFYYFKPGYFQQILIGGKGNKNGVAVSAMYGGGLALGLIKPYYIKVVNPATNLEQDIIDIKYDNNDELFLSPFYLRGSSGFTKGFSEIKLKPGAFVKTAMRFDYGRFNETVSALEVGLNVEYYSQKIPQLLLVKQKQLFFNAYVAIDFGRRK